MVEVVHGPLRGRRRPADAEGRPARAARAVGGSDWPGRLGRSRRRGCEGLLKLAGDSNCAHGSTLPSPFAVAPMAGMTDTAFRRLVKRHGGCGLVVTEMVSSEGLVRGIDRTLEYAEYTEEERPISIQIFGGDPAKMADAAQIVEGMGADIVDVNMGCPVPKIAKHNAGCSLMREPEHAAAVIAAMAKAVKIPGHGQDARRAGTIGERNAPDAGEDGRGCRRGGRGRARPDGRAELQRLGRLGSGRARSPAGSTIPVFGSGDCVEPEQVVATLGERRRGRARRPRRAAQSVDSGAGDRHRRGPAAARGHAADRGQFLLDYIELLRTNESGTRTRQPWRVGRVRQALRPRSGQARRRAQAPRRRWFRRAQPQRGTIAGSSTNCARWCPTTPRASTAVADFAQPSTLPRRSPNSRRSSSAFFADPVSV